jgi:hypothetical protein
LEVTRVDENLGYDKGYTGGNSALIGRPEAGWVDTFLIRKRTARA